MHAMECENREEATHDSPCRTGFPEIAGCIMQHCYSVCNTKKLPAWSQIHAAAQFFRQRIKSGPHQRKA